MRQHQAGEEIEVLIVEVHERVRDEARAGIRVGRDEIDDEAGVQAGDLVPPQDDIAGHLLAPALALPFDRRKAFVASQRNIAEAPVEKGRVAHSHHALAASHALPEGIEAGIEAIDACDFDRRGLRQGSREVLRERA